MVNKFIRRILNTLYRSTCYLCLKDSKYSLRLCELCRADLPYNQFCCPLCAEPYAMDSHQTCGNCLLRPPGYNTCLTPLRYQAPVSDFIQAFKYRADFAAGKLLAELLATKLKQHYRGDWPDAIVPVPMHWTRLWMKGFNHAIQLGNFLNIYLDATIPVSTTFCRKVGRSTPQSRLNAKSRHRNLIGAYTATDACKGLRLALLDDVITTGSTVNACCDALIKAGAAEVHVWALAKTPTKR